MKFALASCLALVHCQDVFLAQNQLNLSTATEADVSRSSLCVQRCQSAGYTCGSCTNLKTGEDEGRGNQNCGSSYNHPSCAMGCHMGQLSTNEKDCENECDKNDNQCTWVFRATLMSNCGSGSGCPGQNRRDSSSYECKIGCRQAFMGHNTNGPQMNPTQALAQVNKIRAQNGKSPMTWRGDKKSCADKEATYNAAHGAHKCGIDGKCNCGRYAAGDFNANDLVDAINRAYATRFSEGPADGTCDTRSHCGALISDAKGIVVGYDEEHAYAVIQYHD